MQHTHKDLKVLKNQVEYCLINYPHTRNSDISLTIKLWEEFYPESILITHDNGVHCIPLNYLFIIPREDNIKRVRANFQSKGQFLPTEKEIAIKRGWKEEEWRKALGYNPEMRQVNLL